MLSLAGGRFRHTGCVCTRAARDLSIRRGAWPQARGSPDMHEPTKTCAECVGDERKMQCGDQVQRCKKDGNGSTRSAITRAVSPATKLAVSSRALHK
jgi:hypothetical protein